MKKLKTLLLISLFIIPFACKAQLNPMYKSVQTDSIRARVPVGKIYFTNNAGKIAWFEFSGDSLVIGDSTGKWTLGALAAAGGAGNVNVSGTPVAGQLFQWVNDSTGKGTPNITVSTNNDTLRVPNLKVSGTINGGYITGGGGTENADSVTGTVYTHIFNSPGTFWKKEQLVTDSTTYTTTFINSGADYNYTTTYAQLSPGGGGAQLVLPPGTWMIEYAVSYFLNNGTWSAGRHKVYNKLRKTSGTAADVALTEESQDLYSGANSTGYYEGGKNFCPIGVTVVTTGTSTTYQLFGKVDSGISTNGVAVGKCTMRATKINKTF
jgi:hypothetical protein